MAALASLLPTSSVLAAPSIFGRWLTDDRKAVVVIEPCGNKLCGKVEQLLDPRAPTRDVNNSDRSHRDDPLVGTMVLRHFTGMGAVWQDGEAYDPKGGKTYRSQLRLLADGRLKVTGCVMFICRSRFWTRAS